MACIRPTLMHKASLKNEGRGMTAAPFVFAPFGHWLHHYLVITALVKNVAGAEPPVVATFGVTVMTTLPFAAA